MTDVIFVFHQAAEVRVDRSIEAPEETHADNVAGRFAVLEATGAEGGHAVLASSAAIYSKPESFPITELFRIYLSE
jgi:UDP-glucose 4-epimerase